MNKITDYYEIFDNQMMKITVEKTGQYDAVVEFGDYMKYWLDGNYIIKWQNKDGNEGTIGEGSAPSIWDIVKLFKVINNHSNDWDDCSILLKGTPL